MVRCPFCGSTSVKNVGFVTETLSLKYGKEREIKHWKSGKPYKIRPAIRRWRKVNTHYKCGLCLRSFDEIMAKDAYLDKEEKEKFIRLLNHYGLTQIAQRVSSIQTPIHIKSDLGKLYRDLRKEESFREGSNVNAF